MTESTAELIQIQYQKLKNINFSVIELIREQLHVHSSTELTILLEGEVLVEAGTRSYRAGKGDMLIFNSYEAHRLVPDPRATLLMLHLAPIFGSACFARLLTVEFDYTPQSLEKGVGDSVISMLIDAAKVFFREPLAFGMECTSLIFGAMTLLIRNVPYSLNSDTEHVAKKKRFSRKQRIAAFVDQHYKDKLTLTQLAQSEGITTAYMSRIFGELFTDSFQEYVSKLRMRKALPMLKKNNIFLVDICMECGFSDTRYLNAICLKEYGCTAAQLREQMQDPAWVDPKRELTPAWEECSVETSLRLLDHFQMEE